MDAAAGPRRPARGATWNLAPVLRAVFDGVLGELPNQLEVLREDVRLSASDLLDVRVEGRDGHPERAAQRCQRGGSVPRRLAGRPRRGWVLNLMEDAAAAEIARAKVLTLPGYERLP